MKGAAQQCKAGRPRIGSQATVMEVTTVGPGVVRAKMRFDVTSDG
jgi:hypothetical protein